MTTSYGQRLHNWKACNRQNRFAGSNPVLSASDNGKGVGWYMVLPAPFCLFMLQIKCK